MTEYAQALEFCALDPVAAVAAAARIEAAMAADRIEAGRKEAAHRIGEKAATPRVQAEVAAAVAGAARLGEADSTGTDIKAPRHGSGVADIRAITTTLGDIWQWPSEGPIKVLAWAGGNLLFVVPQPLSDSDKEMALKAFVAQSKYWGARCSSIVGPTEFLTPFWQQLAKHWPYAREVRDNQPLLSLSEQPKSNIDPEVNASRISELDLILPANIAMFTEEMGYSPLRFGAHTYRQHVANLINAGHSFRRLGPPPIPTSGAAPPPQQVIFKADVGQAALGVAQLQGVWIHPDRRGQGLAKPALAAAIRQIQQTIAPTVALYVNHSNRRARHIYADLGFAQVGTFATVLL
ncbi:MAG: GNAT family N-acetyltransferase [Cellulomonadaceae bacterium]|jgi:GNAT superfamily N-acetyltransferase|nr:GNAT family N-acetyltransferase [Cellulomonadaceae bacterium]